MSIGIPELMVKPWLNCMLTIMIACRNMQTKSMVHSEETWVLGIRANLSSYWDKTNRYTINLDSDVSSGLKKKGNDHSDRNPMVPVWWFLPTTRGTYDTCWLKILSCVLCDAHWRHLISTIHHYFYFTAIFLHSAMSAIMYIKKYVWYGRYSRYSAAFRLF